MATNLKNTQYVNGHSSFVHENKERDVEFDIPFFMKG